MQMGPKEIARDYRTAANKQKQIKVLAELNQCAERKIAEILVEEGEELPKKYQERLQKPTRRSRKFPAGEATPEDDAPAPVSPADRATDRDLFDAVATLLPDTTSAREVSEPSLITREDVCLGACKNLLAALDLKPDEFHCYACGTLDLVFSLIGVPMVWQPIHDREV